jgi:hypothetical protein
LPDVPSALRTMFTNFAVDPANILPIGQTVAGGQILSGRSSSQSFFVAQTTGPDGVAYSFGIGDPPLSADVGFGGGIPLIVNGLKYGTENIYQLGTPLAAPRSGPPGQYSGSLLQRSSAAFTDFVTDYEQRGYYGTGKVIVAHSTQSGALAVVVQPHSVANGVSLSDVRDRLFQAGFDNAIAFDGSDSATLLRSGAVAIAPAYLKDATIPTGIGIRRRGQ